MKITKNQLKKIIRETLYKGVPAKFSADHKKKMGDRMRSDSKFMDLIKTGQIGFGEKGMRYDPELDDTGRPIGISQRMKSSQEMDSIDAMSIADQEERERLNQQREIERERLQKLSLPNLEQQREAMLNSLELIDENTSFPYGPNKGDVRRVTSYRKFSGEPFTQKELQLFKDFDILSARKLGPMAGLIGINRSSLHDDNTVLKIVYTKYTAS